MKCSICGREIFHPLIKNYLGNNPYPVRTGEDDRCCDNCNDMFVTRARLVSMNLPKENMEQFANGLNKERYPKLLRIFGYVEEPQKKAK